MHHNIFPKTSFYVIWCGRSCTSFLLVLESVMSVLQDHQSGNVRGFRDWKLRFQYWLCYFEHQFLLHLKSKQNLCSFQKVQSVYSPFRGSISVFKLIFREKQVYVSIQELPLLSHANFSRLFNFSKPHIFIGIMGLTVPSR